MLAIERAEYIQSILEKNKVAMVTDLSRDMGVTEETVRKDLEKLEKQGKLSRVHGGAYLNEGYGNETPTTVRSKILQKEKSLVAKQCMSLIRTKESIFLDGSTTALQLAKKLSSFGEKLTVITNSLIIAGEVASNPSIRLILLGGEFNRDMEAFEGQSVLDQLKGCFIHKAFISSAGLSLEAGVTDSTREEAELRRQVLRQAKTRIFLADTTKLGRNGVYVIGSLEDLDYLVVNTPFNREQPELWQRICELPITVLDGRKKGEQQDS